MKFEKKNWILLALVAMLCFTGFLNYKFNTTVSDSPQVAMQAPSNTAEQTQTPHRRQTLPTPTPRR